MRHRVSNRPKTTWYTAHGGSTSVYRVKLAPVRHRGPLCQSRNGGMNINEAFTVSPIRRRYESRNFFLETDAVRTVTVFMVYYWHIRTSPTSRNRRKIETFSEMPNHLVYEDEFGDASHWESSRFEYNEVGRAISVAGQLGNLPPANEVIASTYFVSQIGIRSGKMRAKPMVYESCTTSSKVSPTLHTCVRGSTF